MEQHYRDLDLEIILVNDGSEFEVPDVDLNVVVVELPKKTVPMNPCVPFNEGFKVSTGDYIAISNPEILHINPVLEQMREAIVTDKTYVLAAAWCPELKVWHCHTTNKRENKGDVGDFLPPGSDYHFMGMMKRGLWPGFDEDYRFGAGYDDPDFVKRLEMAGAEFLIRDDLIVHHPKTGAKIKWTGYDINRKLFMQKWT